MADDQNESQTYNRNRRSSFAGQTFADLFGTGRPSMARGQTTGENSPPPQQSAAGPISQAAAQAQRRRMSLTTLGLSGSPNSSSPFGSYRGRRDSLASANTDESAIAEDDSPTQKMEDQATPTTPFARRTSFGAKALRDRMGSFNGGGGGGGGSAANGQNGTSRSPPAVTSPSTSKKSPHGTISNARGLSFATPLSVTVDTSLHFRRHSLLTSVSASGEGFNWSDNFRTRAERGSIVGTSPSAPSGMAMGNAGGGHARAKSVAVMEPPPAAAMPPPKESKKPDHFQERILKGDFYMD